MASKNILIDCVFILVVMLLLIASEVTARKLGKSIYTLLNYILCFSSIKIPFSQISVTIIEIIKKNILWEKLILYLL